MTTINVTNQHAVSAVTSLPNPKDVFTKYCDGVLSEEDSVNLETLVTPSLFMAITILSSDAVFLKKFQNLVYQLSLFHHEGGCSDELYRNLLSSLTTITMSKNLVYLDILNTYSHKGFIQRSDYLAMKASI